MISVRCRMCGETTESGVSLLLDPKNKKLAQYVALKFEYQLNTTGLFSSHICSECSDSLQVWMCFLERCKKSQTLFTSIVEAKNSQNGQHVSSVSVEKNKDILEGSPVISAESPRDLALDFADPLLSASELEITAKFPQLKVAVVRLDKDDIEVKRHQQSDITLQHKDAVSSRTERKKFQCQLCDNKYGQFRGLKYHLSMGHKLSKEEVLKLTPDFKCKYCERRYKAPSQLNKHIVCHTLPFQCEICDKRFGRMVHFSRHKLTHSEPQFSCPHCDNKFRQKPNLEMHIANMHSGDVQRDHKCDQCKKMFKRKRDVLAHVRNVHTVYKTLAWKCDQCGKCFKIKKSLYRHIIYTHGEAKYPCVHCGRKFKHTTNLKTHVETEHSGGVRNYQCKNCNKKFKTKTNLNNHIKHVHTVVETLAWKCDECGKRFKHKDYLHKHTLSFHREAKYICSHCGRKFKQNPHLRRHIESQHLGGVRNYQCGHCENKFKTKDCLKYHIRNVHTVHKTAWKCIQCGKCFKLKQYLYIHLVHTHGKAKYSCVHCGRKFKQKTHLKSHIETGHSGGVRNYQCGHCQNKFKTKQTLKQHIKRVHLCKRTFLCIES